MRFEVPIRSIAKSEYDDLLYGIGGGDDVRLLCRLIDLACVYAVEIEKGSDIACGPGVFLCGSPGATASFRYSGRALFRTFDLPNFPWYWRLKRVRARLSRRGYVCASLESFIELLLFWGHISFVSVAILGTSIVALRPNGRRIALRFRPLEQIRRHFLPRM